MKIFIKNMVCQGTRKYVMLEIKKLGLKLDSFDAGELEFSDELSPAQTMALKRSLYKYGLEMKLHNDFSGSLFSRHNKLYNMVIEDGKYVLDSLHITELTQAV